MAKECTLSTGKLPVGGLPRNSVYRIADSCLQWIKASSQTNKSYSHMLCTHDLRSEMAEIDEKGKKLAELDPLRLAMYDTSQLAATISREHVPGVTSVSITLGWPQSIRDDQNYKLVLHFRWYLGF